MRRASLCAAAVASMNSGAESFQYDPFGRRVAKTSMMSTTNYLYDGPNVAQELSGTTVTANLLMGGIDEYFQRTDSSGPANFLTDALGSTLALTDSNGNTIAQYTYEPFGNTTGGSSANPYQYTGRENDGTGLYFYRARYYDPVAGRFNGTDPLEFLSGDGNFYRYIWNNQPNLVDPFGELGGGFTFGGSGGVGIGVGGAANGSLGLGLFSGNGGNGGIFGTGGAAAGIGPLGFRAPNPPGISPWWNGELGYGLGIGAGVFGTNAKNICDLSGPFKTLTIGGGVAIGFELQISWSHGIVAVSLSGTYSPIPLPSGMVSIMPTNTKVFGQNCGCK